MATDLRKNNGGARTGTGPKPINLEEKKIPVHFYVKRKHLALAKKKIKPVVDKINQKN